MKTSWLMWRYLCLNGQGLLVCPEGIITIHNLEGGWSRGSGPQDHYRDHPNLYKYCIIAALNFSENVLILRVMFSRALKGQ